jgi:chromosome segregation ATPase
MEKDRISAEKSDVARTVAVLEADLKRVKKGAEAFGRDLKLLRVEKEKQETKHKEELSRLERSKKQAQTQIRLLNDQLENQREKTSRARDDLKNHVCAPYVNMHYTYGFVLTSPQRRPTNIIPQGSAQ